jgi:serine/threonine protein kinase
MKAYKIIYETELGSGAFGQVFPAVRKADGQELVVKVMLRKKLTPETIIGVESEVSVLRELDHPNIVRLYDFIQDRLGFYLFLERINGGELFDRLVKKETYTEAEARRLCKGILLGLEHCHRRNIVHRDIKPQNLLLLSESDDSDVKIVDFGFACKCVEPNLNEGLGTPIYMAPELWRNQEYGKPVDMWAFGVVVYSLLCGSLPFDGEIVEDIKSSILSGGVAFEGAQWMETSAEAKDFIKCLLNANQSVRLGATVALNHDWVSLYLLRIYQLSDEMCAQLNMDDNVLERHSLHGAIEKFSNFKAQRQLTIAISLVLSPTVALVYIISVMLLINAGASYQEVESKSKPANSTATNIRQL